MPLHGLKTICSHGRVLFSWCKLCVSCFSNSTKCIFFPSSHDRAFLDAVATDIVHQHSQRLDYYKGNFTQFYATKSERSKNLKKEYETQLAYRQHLQVCPTRVKYELASDMH